MLDAGEAGVLAEPVGPLLHDIRVDDPAAAAAPADEVVAMPTLRPLPVEPPPGLIAYDIDTPGPLQIAQGAVDGTEADADADFCQQGAQGLGGDEAPTIDECVQHGGALARSARARLHDARPLRLCPAHLDSQLTCALWITETI
ncbi:hypothetical protein XF35_19820 [Streptomyces platensis subsp. clarensis]|nr:hypothetical protein [Streptomyces platensis subsp. clarensis]